MKNNLVIVSGRTNISLSKKISLKLNAELVIVDTKYFPNGEKRIKINTRLKGKKVVIVQFHQASVWACKQLRPIYARYSALPAFKNGIFIDVDVDENEVRR